MKKVGIVGAGSVSQPSRIPAWLREWSEKALSLFDVAKAKLNAEVPGLNHGLMFVPEVEEHAHNTHQEAALSDRRRGRNL